MSDLNLFLSTRPAYPWSVYPLGLPALGAVAVLLVVLTVWTYLGHARATRRRVALILALRLAALVVALLTAVRPSVGVQDDPKIPSVLLVGVDLSESMTVKDEVNNQARIEAVRKALEKAQPLFDELAGQNVEVVTYAFGPADFSPDASRYDPRQPADGKRSDYGVYLNRSFDRWQGERFVRGHLLIGDGANNGTGFDPAAEAARFGRRGSPLTTFAVGDENSRGDARDVAVVALSCDPSPAPVKTELTVTARVNAYGFAGTRARVRVFVGDEETAEEVTLAKEKDNEVKLTVKAPGKPGEYKVRFEVGRAGAGGAIEPLPGEVTGLNNRSETYLTVTKEGVRVLVIDRHRSENFRLLDALAGEKRFDVNAVWRQTTLPPAADERAGLDLEERAYDVVILGNVTFDQLTSADRRLPEVLLDRVVNKGMGLMFLGGEAAYTKYPPPPAGDPATRPLVFADLLPVVPSPGEIVESLGPNKQPARYYQTVPTAKALDDGVMKVDKDAGRSRELWDELNAKARPRARLSGLNKLAKKPAATLYAWATATDAVVPAGTPPAGDAAALLVGQQVGEGGRGRVLAFGGFDTNYWEQLGQPKANTGTELHHRFWRQCVLWLAHQEEEEGQVYARPEYRRLPAGGDQVIRVGLKSPAGGDDPNAEVEVKVLPPGQGTPEDEARAPRQTVVKDAKGSKVLFKPPTAGEYTVVATAPVKDAAGQPVIGADGQPQRYRGVARFLAYPEVSDEMLNVAADPRFLERLASAGGGKALRLEDLSGYLRELRDQPPAIRPKPKYLPDWRRNHSKGFLPGWLVVFVTLLGVEWGLRRFWGMV